LESDINAYQWLISIDITYYGRTRNEHQSMSFNAFKVLIVWVIYVIFSVIFTFVKLSSHDEIGKDVSIVFTKLFYKVTLEFNVEKFLAINSNNACNWLGKPRII